MKGATSLSAILGAYADVSIHAPNEGSDQKRYRRINDDGVSIHAPNEGSDVIATLEATSNLVSIHAPNEGSDTSYRSAGAI